MTVKNDKLKNCITEAERVEAAAESLYQRLSTLADVLENAAMNVGKATAKLNTPKSPS
jgi:hypothetical protein